MYNDPAASPLRSVTARHVTTVGHLPMSMTPILPQVFWFRMAIPCRRVEGLPRGGNKGRLLDLPDDCALPDFAQLEGRTSWARLKAAWNPGGLALSIEVSGKAGPIRHDPTQQLGSDGVQIWIDTRDTRDVHRATRFCHRFSVSLIPAASGDGVDVEVKQGTIARALADAPKGRPEAISARAERIRKGWRLELFFSAAALHGFDPDTNRRLGLAYRVSDAEREDQFLGVGREFPIGEDPSLWATLELVEGGK